MWESHTVAMTFIYCKCYIIGAYFCPVEVEATHPLLQHVLLPRPLTTSSSFPQFRCQRTTCIVTQALPPTPPPSWHHQVSEWHNVNVKWHDMKRSAYWFHVMLHDITVHYTQIATPPWRCDVTNRSTSHSGLNWITDSCRWRSSCVKKVYSYGSHHQCFGVNVMSPHNKILCSYNIMMSWHNNSSIIMSQHNKLLCIYNIMMS